MGVNISAIINSKRLENSKTLYRNNFITIDKPNAIARAAGKFIKKQITKIEKS